MCVFFQVFQVLVKLKPNEVVIWQIIYVEYDHYISKCPSFSELFQPSNPEIKIINLFLTLYHPVSAVT